jgi:hypothetical protein
LLFEAQDAVELTGAVDAAEAAVARHSSVAAIEGSMAKRERWGER